MPSTTIANFDAGRIPDVSDEANFHADATYVFEHMASDIIPGINANLEWMNAALAGAETLVDAVADLQGLVGDTTPFAKTLLDDPDATTARATLEAQVYSANLTTALAAYTLPEIAGAAGQLLFNSSAGMAAWSDIGDLIAGQDFGAVGTYAFLTNPVATADTIVAGSTYAGSGLYPAGIRNNNGVSTGSDNPDTNADAGICHALPAMSGTWQAMGSFTETLTRRSKTTLYLRIL
ncbi:hypothetical protein DS901_06680 [Loktanella sp. D2R18]|uniref:hypothetical protein n=1 Tax=Rhodobacterales TaxID=204455 RepID=UPI000DEA3DF4|nr:MULTISPECIES: hypothetical protein [Rhodobacterales]MDO6589455.1 hypothetical protein [Yoonia sp. 1_MG-2023]RBW44106.1 hypothetical protein DS901_06680 [Loktanella sp. D2R18]